MAYLYTIQSFLSNLELSEILTKEVLPGIPYLNPDAYRVSVNLGQILVIEKTDQSFQFPVLQQDEEILQDINEKFGQAARQFAKMGMELVPYKLKQVMKTSNGDFTRGIYSISDQDEKGNPILCLNFNGAVIERFRGSIESIRIEAVGIVGRKKLKLDNTQGRTLYYYKNTQNGTISPYYLSLENQLIPASAEIGSVYSPSPIEKVDDFVKDEVVMWVRLPQPGENLIPGLGISVGQKVINLGRPKGQNSEILYFEGSGYVRREFPFMYLQKKTVDLVDLNYKNFMRDANHVILQAGKYKGKSETFDTLVEKTRSRLPLIKNDFLFTQGILAFMNYLKDSTNKVSELNKCQTLIESSYNLYVNGESLFEYVIPLPISLEWIEEDSRRIGFYKQFLEKHNLFAWPRGSASGEVIDNTIGIKSDLYAFCKALTDSNSQVTEKDTSPEMVWIEQNINVLANAEKCIIIHSESWNYNEEDRYASSIGLVNTIGPIFFPPLLTIIIHETNQSLPFSRRGTSGINYLGDGDSHIFSQSTMNAWSVCRSSGVVHLDQFLTTEIGGDYMEDALYQVNSCISLVCLAIFLDFLNVE